MVSRQGMKNCTSLNARGIEGNDGMQRHVWLMGHELLEVKEVRDNNLEPWVEICLQATGC